MSIIAGIDAATDPKKVGLALGVLEGLRVTLTDARLGETEAGLVSTLAGWVSSGQRVLLAIDAPLGWPAELGDALAKHEAGNGLSDAANILFRRGTDRFIRSRIGKQSLDVGADRIARTAVAALSLLEAVRATTMLPIPLAWDVDFAGVAAIEVYPSATLRSHGISAAGYKAPGDSEARRTILEAVAAHVEYQCDHGLCVANADVLDAVLCMLAGADFLLGHALGPLDPRRARREGWIWVRDPELGCDCGLNGRGIGGGPAVDTLES